MKKILLSLTLFISLLIAETKMEYTVSYVGMNMDYKEYDRTGVLLDSEDSAYSDITGVEFSYGYILDKNSQIDLSIMSLSGKSDYIGSYLGSNDPYGSLESTTWNEIRDIYIGYSAKNFSRDLGFVLLGNIGFGYRYWERQLSRVQIEEYEWYSIRLGIGAQYQYRDFTIAIRGEYQYGIDPTMTATGIDEEFHLNSANIMELSIPLRYEINETFALKCTYVFTRQEIKESNVVFDDTGYGYVEPDSTAYNQYLKIGIIFKY